MFEQFTTFESFDRGERGTFMQPRTGASHDWEIKAVVEESRDFHERDGDGDNILVVTYRIFWQRKV